jgi:hypothetical protein
MICHISASKRHAGPRQHTDSARADSARACRRSATNKIGRDTACGERVCLAPRRGTEPEHLQGFQPEFFRGLSYPMVVGCSPSSRALSRAAPSINSRHLLLLTMYCTNGLRPISEPSASPANEPAAVAVQVAGLMAAPWATSEPTRPAEVARDAVVGNVLDDRSTIELKLQV